MTFSDGYGDQPTPEQVITETEPLIRFLAARYVDRGSPTYHDLVQEGLLHYWNTLLAKPGQKKAYYVEAAKRRMSNVAVRAFPMTGSESEGRHYRPKTTSVDWAEADSFLMLVAADLLRDVAFAYHRGQIVQALRDLPEADRDFVIQRFWFGKTNEEIRAEQGLPHNYLDRRWSRAIKPKLQASLIDLRELVR